MINTFRFSGVLLVLLVYFLSVYDAINVAFINCKYIKK